MFLEKYKNSTYKVVVTDQVYSGDTVICILPLLSNNPIEAVFINDFKEPVFDKHGEITGYTINSDPEFVAKILNTSITKANELEKTMTSKKELTQDYKDIHSILENL